MEGGLGGRGVRVCNLQELQRRLQFALSDPHFSPRFLAMNAALLPHLWRNQSHQPPKMDDLGDGRWDVELVAAGWQELLEETERVPPLPPQATAAGFGPLTMLANQVPRLYLSGLRFGYFGSHGFLPLNPNFDLGLWATRRCGNCPKSVKRGLFSMGLQVWNSSMKDYGNFRKSHCRFGQLLCWCTLHVHCWFL